jgi:hypothetical protein
MEIVRSGVALSESLRRLRDAGCLRGVLTTRKMPSYVAAELALAVVSVETSLLLYR